MAEPEQWVLVDPVASGRENAAPSPKPRPHNTIGTVGLFSNNKQNATEIQAVMGKELRYVFGVDIRVYLKLNASVPAEPELVDQMVADCDAVITGSGDCGSCTAASVHDTRHLRARGLPVLMLGSSTFEGLARMQARSLGDPGIELCVVQHPIGGLSPDELEKRCIDAAAQAVDWFRALVTFATAS